MFQDATAFDAAGRLCIVFFFVVAGLCNLTPARIRDHIDRMAAARTPFPAALFWIGTAMQFTGCALLLAGWHADIGTWLLIVFTIVAGAIFHRFWEATDPQRRNLLRVMLLNNIGVLGGLFLLLASLQ